MGQKSRREKAIRESDQETQPLFVTKIKKIERKRIERKSGAHSDSSVTARRYEATTLMKGVGGEAANKGRKGLIL